MNIHDTHDNMCRKWYENYPNTTFVIDYIANSFYLFKMQNGQICLWILQIIAYATNGSDKFLSNYTNKIRELV